MAPTSNERLRRGSAADLYDAAVSGEYDVPILQVWLQEIGDAEYCYLFARDVMEADIPSLEACVITWGNNDQCYRFARDVVGANNSVLQQRILQTGSALDCCQFAEDIYNADIELLRARVVALGGDSVLLERFGCGETPASACQQ
ncbi:MAG: hypothetical protein M0Z83_02865 [Betaproteobacteria bacterium]|nr:hypothetical protein [Betaproteobacteria bacterium]